MNLNACIFLSVLLTSQAQAAIYFCSAEKSSSMAYDTEINQVTSQTNFMVDTANGYSTIGNRLVEQVITYVGSCQTSSSNVFCLDGALEKGDLNQSSIHISLESKTFLYVNHNVIAPVVTTVTGLCDSLAPM